LQQLAWNHETSRSIIELDAQVANLGVITRQPFDVVLEGQFLKSSGEDGTAIELFIAGVRDWEAGLTRFLAASADGK
jgi:hypothetical protein